MKFEHLQNLVPADERVYCVFKAKNAPTSPLTLQTTGWNLPENLGTFAEASALVAGDPSWNLGLAFTADNYIIGIDLDDCYNPANGLLEEWAENILYDLPSGYYAEVSGGGYGIKVILLLDERLDLKYKGTYLKGELGRPDFIPADDTHKSGSHAEVFVDKKYFALTGNIFGQFNGLETVKMTDVRRIFAGLRGEQDNLDNADHSANEAPAEAVEEAENNTCWTQENLLRLLKMLPTDKANDYDNWFMIVRAIRNVAGSSGGEQWQDLAVEWSTWLDDSYDVADVRAKVKQIFTEPLDGSRSISDIIKKATTQDWVLYSPDNAMQIKQLLAELDFGSQAGIYSGGTMHNYRIAVYLKSRAFSNLICVEDIEGRPRYYLRNKGVLTSKDAEWIKKTVGYQMNQLIENDPANIFRGYLNGFKSQSIVEMILGMVPEYHFSHIDAEPYLLNVKNGVVDLNTGSFRPHNDTDLFSRQCPTEFNPNADCPEFKKALRIWLREDDMIDYAQRMFGMMLAGEDVHKKLLVVSGVTGSGKSTFCRAVTNVLGGIEGSNTSYACKADVQLLQDGAAAQKEQRQILGDMLHRRLTIVSENEESFKVSDTMLKQLTGGQGEVVKFRMSHRDWDTMPCSNSIVIETNFIPEFGSDLATQRRIRRLLFNYSFDYEGASEKRVDLGAVLKSEASGILNWLLEGYAKVRDYTGDNADKGLHRPAKALGWDVIEADEDPFVEWLDECCILGTGRITSAKDLRDSFVGMGNGVSAATFRDLIRNYRDAEGTKFEYHKKGEHSQAKRSPVVVGIGLKPKTDNGFGGGL